MNRKLQFLLTLCVCLLTINSCWVYKFNDISLPEGCKTFSVSFFPNRAAIVQPTLSQKVTSDLRAKFNSDTNLEQVKRDGDLQFDGEITGYEITPVGVVAGEKAAMNRLTVTVHVKHTNAKDAKYNFDQNFSRFKDFNATLNVTSVEGKLIPEIVEELIDDIFKKAVANW